MCEPMYPVPPVTRMRFGVANATRRRLPDLSLAPRARVCENGAMTEPGCVAALEQPTAESANTLLLCARAVEVSLRDGAREVADQAAAQGRTDAIEAVTGQSSLAKGAAELAQLIRQVELKLSAPSEAR